MRLRFLLLLPFVLLTACYDLPKKYYHVTVMNLNGDLISSWTARGGVYRTWEDGLYSMIAVERFTGKPTHYYRYPLGWRVHVGGPNMVIYRVEEPEWLRQQTDLDVADQADQKAGVQ